MSGAFIQILWGMVFEMVDVRLEWFDVALDAIGYFLIFTALPRLAPAAAAFGTARAFALIAGIVSLPAMLPIKPFQPFQALQGVLNLFMLWYICSGIVELARARTNTALALDADKVRTLNVIMYSGAVFLAILAAMGDVSILAVPVLLFGIVVAILTLLLLKRASVEFA